MSGYNAAFDAEATATAFCVRATAIRSVGLSASPSAMRPSSCGSPRVFHQSCAGHALAEIRAFANDCALASESLACKDADGASPCVLAQAATTAATTIANPPRTSSCLTLRPRLFSVVQPQGECDQRAAGQQQFDCQVGAEGTQLREQLESETGQFLLHVDFLTFMLPGLVLHRLF